MDKSTIFKVFGCALIILCAIVLLELMISSGDAKEVYETYDSVKVDTTSGTSKKLMFLQEYTRISGDTTLAISRGIDKDTANSWAAGHDGESEGGSGIIRPPVSGSWQQQLDTLAASNSTDAPHYNNQNFKIVSINGTEFIYESQNSQYPLTYGGNSTVKDAGCFLFAMSAIVSNKSGQIVSVADMMAKNGSTVTFSDNYAYNYPSNSKFNLNGSLSSARAILAMYSLDNGAEEIVNNGSIVAGKDFHGSIKSAIDNGYCVLYYCHNGQGTLASSSGGGNHWTVIVGYDSSNYYFLCNGNRSNAVNKETVKQLCKHAWVLK